MAISWSAEALCQNTVRDKPDSGMPSAQIQGKWTMRFTYGEEYQIEPDPPPRDWSPWLALLVAVMAYGGIAWSVIRCLWG